MSNDELVRQLKTASIQADDMRLKNFGFLMKTASDTIEELQKQCKNWEDTACDWRDAYHHWLDNYMKDVPKWIPAEERLPDKGGTYLIACGNGLITTDEFMVWPDRVKTYYNWDDYGGGIKYWMEIPKPPNEFFESLKRGLEQAINGETREITIEVEDGSD